MFFVDVVQIDWRCGIRFFVLGSSGWIHGEDWMDGDDRQYDENE